MALVIHHNKVWSPKYGDDTSKLFWGSVLFGEMHQRINIFRHNISTHKYISSTWNSNKKYVSDEVIALFCACLIFTLFMIPVVQHNIVLDEADHQWSTVDCFYFWIVTFTTVGFGDIHFSLDAEVEHAYVFLMYRILCLSFVAAVLESVQLYMKYCNKVLKKNLKRYSVHLRDRIFSLTSDEGWQTHPLKENSVDCRIE